jgi:hypothetical protein
VRLQEKGGKRHEMRAHHKLEHFLDEYLDAAGIRENVKTPFSLCEGKTVMLTDRPLHRVDAYEMVSRRANEAGFKVKLGCHIFRATGITVFSRQTALLTRRRWPRMKIRARDSPMTHDRPSQTRSGREDRCGVSYFLRTCSPK